jgi:hypothetical protein
VIFIFGTNFVVNSTKKLGKFLEKCVFSCLKPTNFVISPETNGEIFNNTKLKKALKFSWVLLGMERERQRKRKKRMRGNGWKWEGKWMDVRKTAVRTEQKWMRNGCK